MPEPETDTTPDVAEPPMDTAGEEPQEVAAASTPEVPAQEPPATGEALQNEVVFEFLGPCWVDIRDSTRKFKLFGEMNKGKRKVLEGTPPYSVILGNSAMVRVTVNGQPFDVDSLSHGSVARFTLDPTSSN
jgi:cytoskeleton protein RodZ